DRRRLDRRRLDRQGRRRHGGLRGAAEVELLLLGLGELELAELLGLLRAAPIRRCGAPRGLGRAGGRGLAGRGGRRGALDLELVRLLLAEGVLELLLVLLAQLLDLELFRRGRGDDLRRLAAPRELRGVAVRLGALLG